MRPEYKVEFNVPWAGREYDKINLNVGSESDAYAKVPLIYRALQIRCSSLVRVPRYIYRLGGQGDIVGEGNGQYEFEEDLPMRELLWKTEAGMLLKGFSPVLKLRNEYSYGKGLQWLNPFTVHWIIQKDHLAYYQILRIDGERFPKVGFWQEDDFLMFKEFDPLRDLGPGVSAVQVALGDSQIIANVTSFLDSFFGADAIPITMLMMPNGTNPEEVKKVETWFKKKVKEMQKSVARVLGVSMDVKVERLTNELRSYDFAQVDMHALQGISDAFGVPQSLLRSASGANRAISDNERESFLHDTIIPRCEYFESIINPFLKDFDQRIEFAPAELPEMQHDELARGQALKALTDSGVPLKAGLDMLGYELSDDADKLIDDAVKKKEDLANRPPITPVGGTIPPRGEQPPAPPNQVPNPQDKQPPPVKAEVERFLRKGTNAYQKGKSPVVPFDSMILTDEMKAHVSEILEGKVFMNEMKVGNRHSEADRKRLQAIHDMSSEMGARCAAVKANTQSGILQMIHDQSVELGAKCDAPGM